MPAAGCDHLQYPQGGTVQPDCEAETHSSPPQRRPTVKTLNLDTGEQVEVPQGGSPDPERLIAALASIQADASTAAAVETDPARHAVLMTIYRTADTAIREARGM